MPADRTQLVEAWREVDLQHLAAAGRRRGGEVGGGAEKGNSQVGNKYQMHIESK